MDELFDLHPNGLFRRAEALSAGYDDRDLLRATRAGLLRRLRVGTYMPAAGWPDDPEARHLLTAQAVTLRHPHRVALSHTTGALAHGLRLWEPDLSRTHVTRLEGHNGHVESDVAYHRDRWDADTLASLDEMLVIDSVRCALGAATLTSVEGGVVVLDSLLEQDEEHVESMRALHSTMTRSPFTRSLQIALRLARRGSESVGESRTRHLFWRERIPEPTLQYEVFDGQRLVGRCDFAWPEHGLLGEFDGLVKYRRLVRPGEDPSDVVVREKKRENELRELTGFRMIRFVYGDLYVPKKTSARTRRMLHAAAA